MHRRPTKTIPVKEQNGNVGIRPELLCSVLLAFLLIDTQTRDAFAVRQIVIISTSCKH